MYYYHSTEREESNELGHEVFSVRYVGPEKVHDAGSATEWENGEHEVTFRAWSTAPFAIVITCDRHDAPEPTVTVTLARRLPEGGISEEN